MTYTEHKFIWLQPWCEHCENNTTIDRLWCQDDAWSGCEDCGKKSVKYRLARTADKESAP